MSRNPYRQPAPPPGLVRRRQRPAIAAVLTVAAALFLSLAIPVAAAHVHEVHSPDDTTITAPAFAYPLSK